MWTASCPVVTEAVSFGENQMRYEADCSPTSTAKVQNAGNYSFHSLLCLIKHSHNSTFAFIQSNFPLFYKLVIAEIMRIYVRWMITDCIKIEVIYKKVVWLISRLSQHLHVVTEVNH
jgi:hypothetical protein